MNTKVQTTNILNILKDLSNKKSEDVLRSGLTDVILKLEHLVKDGNIKTDKELSNALVTMMCGDKEIDHINADLFILEVLDEVGYPKLAKTYDELTAGFWYA